MIYIRSLGFVQQFRAPAIRSNPTSLLVPTRPPNQQQPGSVLPIHVRAPTLSSPLPIPHHAHSNQATSSQPEGNARWDRPRRTAARPTSSPRNNLRRTAHKTGEHARAGSYGGRRVGSGSLPPAGTRRSEEERQRAARALLRRVPPRPERWLPVPYDGARQRTAARPGRQLPVPEGGGERCDLEHCSVVPELLLHVGGPAATCASRRCTASELPSRSVRQAAGCRDVRGQEPPAGPPLSTRERGQDPRMGRRRPPICKPLISGDGRLILLRPEVHA